MADQKRPRLTAQRKFEIYLATRGEDAPVGEILRQYGIHLSDLREIEKTVEASAVEGLKARSKRAKKPVSPKEYIAVVNELRRKEEALSELAVEVMLLKKTVLLQNRWFPRVVLNALGSAA